MHNDLSCRVKQRKMSLYKDILEKNELLTPSVSCFVNSKTNQTYFSKAERHRPEVPSLNDKFFVTSRTAIF